ncbi:MAG: 30S ribosomal protein S27e [Candidatus Thermoplasmatota archaeon]|jgi:small subunit ribosomal protein S27e|nr:30S ribosomal protein S27e [Candidatus Thermoplasmatota archaeon]MCL5680847.1 30S ribosomal protein S27e [Candidatus Thermoplasmatota archaeon]
MFKEIKGLEKSFIKIKCPDCGSETVTFARASSEVKCQVCNTTIAKPTGGKVVVSGEITGEYK